MVGVYGLHDRGLSSTLHNDGDGVASMTGCRSEDDDGEGEGDRG